MARLAGPLQFTGSMEGISAYRMKGVGRVVLRMKGGPTRQQIRNHINFANTRLNNQEWKACTMASKHIRLALHDTGRLADYNISGPLTGLCKRLQPFDTVSEKGQRGILLSAHTDALEGFPLTKNINFDTVIRHPLQFEINRATGSAAISLPALAPGIHFFNPGKQPFYRLVLVLGAAPDIVFDGVRHGYQPAVPAGTDLPWQAVLHTGWRRCNTTAPAENLALQLQGWQPGSAAVLLLSAGVEFGIPGLVQAVDPVKYPACAKVVRAV